jgi:hypothetical protein
VEQQCRGCDFDESTTPVGRVASALSTEASAIGESMRLVAADVVRRRPRPDVWAPIEYLGHLRESMAFHRWLIERAVTEDRPVIGQVDPDASVASADYCAADVEELIGQFGRRIDRLIGLVTTLDEAALSRVALLDDREISAALIARSAWHECHHHHGDIRRIGHLEC